MIEAADTYGNAIFDRNIESPKISFEIQSGFAPNC